MPTQKTFKARVRTRMIKTGESYTSARQQLLRKAGAPLPGVVADAVDATPAEAPSAGAAENSTDAKTVRHRSTSEGAIRRATGRAHDEWFALLDEWGGASRRHAEIARWLQEAHGVGGWWAQSITVDYERARGMRDRHQIDGAYTVSATRTVQADASRLLAAFTDNTVREGWLPGAAMQQRATRASLSARFDWADPPSRVVVTAVEKEAGKVTVAVQHEQLPDAATAERLKSMWRERLGVLKAVLERG